MGVVGLTLYGDVDIGMLPVCYDFYIRWVGVVGLTLYGDVDIGMSNIDITYSRYQAVDYSAWIR